MTRRYAPIEAETRRDVAAIVSGHPMGETLAAVAFRLAGLLDGDLREMVIAGVAMTEDDPTTAEDQERAEDEALRTSDPVRWQLARMDRGGAAHRFVAALERRYPSTTTTTDTEA